MHRYVHTHSHGYVVNITFMYTCRIAAEEQERRDYELAMRLAQVSNDTMIGKSLLVICITVAIKR